MTSIDKYPVHLDSQSDANSLCWINNEVCTISSSHLHAIESLKGIRQDEEALVPTFRSKYDDRELFEKFVDLSGKLNRTLASFEPGQIMDYFKLRKGMIKSFPVFRI